jgi:hypothetical protein
LTRFLTVLADIAPFSLLIQTMGKLPMENFCAPWNQGYPPK